MGKWGKAGSTPGLEDSRAHRAGDRAGRSCSPPPKEADPQPVHPRGAQGSFG